MGIGDVASAVMHAAENGGRFDKEEKRIMATEKVVRFKLTGTITLNQDVTLEAATLSIRALFDRARELGIDPDVSMSVPRLTSVKLT